MAKWSAVINLPALIADLVRCCRTQCGNTLALDAAVIAVPKSEELLALMADVSAGHMMSRPMHSLVMK